MPNTLKILAADNHDRDAAGLLYVYPVVSRRAGGVSVGINLNPNNACNWACVYCQVPDLRRGTAPVIDLARLERELRGFLSDLLRGDFMQTRVPEDARRIVDVALSGNGEPTSAAEFPQVVDLIGGLLAEEGLAGKVVPRLITNGSLMGRAAVQRGLARLGELGGEAWFKVDAGSTARLSAINGISGDPRRIARHLGRCADLCPTWVQTCAFAIDGRGPTDADLADYLDLLERAGLGKLRGVLLYGLARPSMQPDATHLSALSAEALQRIAKLIREKGLTVKVSP